LIKLRSKAAKKTELAKTFRYKQAIIIRADLKMSSGKAAAQASHGAVSAVEKARKQRPSWLRDWLDEGQRKVVLKVSSEAELLELEKKAKALRIPVALISDLGLTELPPGTVTALGVGPSPSSLVDKVTGNLPLY
jgi:PTH2 family peptidyl-tRNA hydrolase